MSIFLPGYNRPSWGGRKAVAGEHKMGTGDMAHAAMIENTKETAIDVEVINGSALYPVFARWVKDGSKYYYRVPYQASWQ